jgi:hypothetical protein
MRFVRYPLALVALLFSCSNPVCGCTPLLPVHAVVWGRVSLDTGAPASGAVIKAAVSEATAPCVHGTFSVLGIADTQGDYRLGLFAEVSGDSACVFLEARYPGDQPSTRDTVVGPYRMRVRGSPLDSISVFIVLEP